MKKQTQKKFVKKKVTSIKPEKSAKKKPVEKVIFIPQKYRSADLTRLVVPPVILISVLFLLLSGYLFLQLFTRQLMINSPMTSYSQQSYPVFSPPTTPEITAQSAIIMENNTKTILYEKNPTFRFSMASTTKVMTALVALEQFQLDDVLTVQRPFVVGTTAGFHFGEQLRFEDVLYALLLPSGNDAAYVLADNYPGGVEAFIAQMNQKAFVLGLENTHFGDPAGLEDEVDYTTARDLARFTSTAIQHPVIAKVISTQTYQMSDRNGIYQYSFSNLNKLLGTQGVNGVKTGTTEGAGEVLITSTTQQGKTFIIIVMKSQNRFADTELLLTYLRDHTVFIRPQYPFIPTVE